MPKKKKDDILKKIEDAVSKSTEIIEFNSIIEGDEETKANEIKIAVDPKYLEWYKRNTKSDEGGGHNGGAY